MSSRGEPHPALAPGRSRHTKLRPAPFGNGRLRVLVLSDPDSLSEGSDLPFRWPAFPVLAIVGLAAAALAAAAGPDVRAAQDQDWRRAPARDECPNYVILEPAEYRTRAFYFTRGVYSGGGMGGWRRGGSWATDFPKADRQFLVVLRRLVGIDASPCENAVRLDDPALRKFPFLYMLEVGYMGMTPAEVDGLRGYLLAGGFLMVDDFWGSWQWANFEAEIRRVLPEYEIVELPLEHEVFRAVYNIKEILQVPSINNARYGRYWEQDGYTPYVRGIFDEKGRLLVGIVWNSDLGDAWEWAEQPDYPVDRSTFAFQMGVNFIVYSMSH